MSTAVESPRVEPRPIVPFVPRRRPRGFNPNRGLLGRPRTYDGPPTLPLPGPDIRPSRALQVQHASGDWYTMLIWDRAKWDRIPVELRPRGAKVDKGGTANAHLPHDAYKTMMHKRRPQIDAERVQVIARNG